MFSTAREDEFSLGAPVSRNTGANPWQGGRLRIHRGGIPGAWSLNQEPVSFGGEPTGPASKKYSITVGQDCALAAIAGNNGSFRSVIFCVLRLVRSGSANLNR